MKKQQIIFIGFLLVIILCACLWRGIVRHDGFENGKEMVATKIKYVNLVLYSDNAEYNEMKEITQEYYNKFKNVKTIYYKYDEKINEEYLMEGDVLKIKGKESYVPGILEKTVKAMEYVEKDEYDYLVRSNISTIVDFKLLDEELKKNPVEYGGGLINNLQRLDENAGIKDDAHFGLKYVSGTAIIMSKDALKEMIEKKDKIDYKIVDDVSIGVLMRFLKKSPVIVKEGSFLIVSDTNGDAEKIIKMISEKPYIFYRNRNNDRKTDVKQMRIIVNYLLKQK
jgi:hypothetical protein